MAGERIARPIILIGAPRSGTTLLADIVSAHPDVAVAREPRLVWRFGNDRRSDELRVEHARPEVVDHIHASFAALLRDEGRSRLAEKTPANSVRPAFVDAVFPNACFVHITRNGWGAVPSMRTFWERRGSGLDGKQMRKLRRRLREARLSQLRHYAPELVRRATGAGRHTSLYGPRLAGLQQMADELGRLETAALQWRACVEQTSSFGRTLPADRYLELRLEDLDAAAVDAMVSFCGLDGADEVLERFAKDFEGEAATRRAPLTADERALVAPYVVPANAWLGYDPSDDDDDIAAEVGRPR